MDEGDSMQFRRQLLQVAEGLGKEDVEGLKFLCKDLIPFSKLQAMPTAREVFQFLISNDVVNQEDVFVIAELLYRIRRNYLLPRIGYTKQMVQENLHLKGIVSEFRQMLYELSEELTENDLRSAEFLLRGHLPKRQSTVMSGVELLTILERKDLLSEDDLSLLEKVCKQISPDLLRKINTYKLKRVSLSVQESKETEPSSVRKSSLEGSSLSAGNQEESVEYPTKSLDSGSSLRELIGHVQSFGSNQDVKAGNVVGSSEQTFPVRKQDGESKMAAEYEMDVPCKGHCLIFNNVNFEGHLAERKGSQKDVEELEKVFRWLGLEVVTYNDQTSVEIHQQLQKWQTSDHWKDSNCFVCCILSHGRSGEIYGTDAQLIPIRTIMSYFTANVCPLLARKPKLFFIQACQGEKTQRPVYLERDSDERDLLSADAQSAGPPSQAQPSIPEEADFLLGMATVDGYLSFRHTREGTWYIQALCANLQLLVPRGEDILSILTEVNKEVSYRADPQGMQKQMPQPAFTLRRKLVFPVPKEPPPSPRQ
ncbi:caspase-8-like isoform X2 [Paroedura picta]|uniref:caspase-8-like isoform X2 n=1 Tax=Paroedura picta TaxID=143630 RepID=UPI004055F927